MYVVKKTLFYIVFYCSVVNTVLNDGFVPLSSCPTMGTVVAKSTIEACKNGRYFAYHILNALCLKKLEIILIKISLKFMWPYKMISHQ